MKQKQAIKLARKSGFVVSSADFAFADMLKEFANNVEQETLAGAAKHFDDERDKTPAWANHTRLMYLDGANILRNLAKEVLK